MKKILRHGLFIHGPEVTNFERQFAQFHGAAHCIGVGSGTDALIAALRALQVGTHDEVIVPTFTFVSTAFAVLSTGATPVFVDVTPHSLTIDPALISRAITKRTKAIIPVHLYGRMADMDAIQKIARTRKLFVVEDAAQAHGSTLHGKKAGTLGDIGCFSFYPSKNLGGLGDGGAVITKSKIYADFIRTYCNVGQEEKYRHSVIGINSRLDTIQAAYLSIQLSQLEKHNKKRRSHADLYSKLLHNTPLRLPSELPGYMSTYHLYVVQTKYRDALRSYLLHSHQIETGIHYPLPLHLQPSLRHLSHTSGSFPISEKAAKEVLSLPMYPNLRASDITRVSHGIHEFFRLRERGKIR
jgi:dTDP-4-amino-4,6-dideoxygalactose transaminase